MDGLVGIEPVGGDVVWPKGWIQSENGFLSEDGFVPKERLLSGIREPRPEFGRSAPILRGGSGRLRSIISSGFGSFRSALEIDGRRSDLTSQIASRLFNRFAGADRSMPMDCRSSVRRSRLNCLSSESRFVVDDRDKQERC